MISVKFSYYGHGTLICLCDDCKKKLMEVLPSDNNSEIPNSSDTISREKAIAEVVEALRGLPVVCKDIAEEAIKQLPPALPEPMKIDLSRCSEENWERIKKEWANTPITTIAAQPYTIIDGRLFITVDDIEQVDCVLVAEYKSKFCREFWMADADEPAQPERIKGHWIIRETSSGDTEARCSHCGFTTLVDEPGNGLHMVSDLNFCPNCGADMRGEQDEY